MNATQLYTANNTPADIWVCQICKKLYGKSLDREPQKAAERCCTPRRCSTCNACLPLRQYFLKCVSCREKEQGQKKIELFEKSKKYKPSEYNGPVFDRRDRMFDDLEAFFDHYHGNKVFEDELRDGTWVWLAREIKFRPSVSMMLSQAFESHYDGAADTVSESKVKELEDFVGQWAEQLCIVSYEPDYTQCVVLGGEQENEECQSCTPNSMLVL